MKITNLALAAEILTTYAPGDAVDCVRAEHDEIYIGDTSWPITEEDKAKLLELGFHPCNEGCYHAFT